MAQGANAHPAHLLRVQRQVVAEHTRRFPGRYFGQRGNVIQHAGDVVEQGEKAGIHGVRTEDDALA